MADTLSRSAREDGRPELPERQQSARLQRWAATMMPRRVGLTGLHAAHPDRPFDLGAGPTPGRSAREAMLAAQLAAGATRAEGAGRRRVEEEPDAWRTCFERDRDRILHASAFRRLAGKTQVFVFPEDHQRTRLTHALEVAQVARSIAAALRLNEALAEAISLGHDCGHGPFGHASEDALDAYLPGGFDHAPWGADVTLAALNLTREVADGIRNHSWSRPAPGTAEGEVCALADRIAYATHDAEDAIRAGIVSEAELPDIVVELAGRTHSEQLHFFVEDAITTSLRLGAVGISEDAASALGALRSWNYERIYLRPESIRQSALVQRMLGALVEHFAAHPEHLPAYFREGPEEDPLRRAVTWVAGMTDRFACVEATRLLDWPEDEWPRGFDLASRTDPATEARVSEP